MLGGFFSWLVWGVFVVFVSLLGCLLGGVGVFWWVFKGITYFNKRDFNFGALFTV